MTRIITTLEIIQYRQAKLFDTVRQTMRDRDWLAVRDASSVRSFGGIVNLRPLMLAKVGIFDEGVNLFSHWPAIEHERRIPWNVHAANMALSTWSAVGSEMHNKFYSTKTKDFSALEMTDAGLAPGRRNQYPRDSP